LIATQDYLMWEIKEISRRRKEKTGGEGNPVLEIEM
jgi:hypothetical protein